MLVANERDGYEVTTTWPGSVVAGNTGAERRVSSSNRPGRTLRHTIRADTQAAAWMVRNYGLRMGLARSLAPLYPDVTVLTAPSSGAVLTCDTTLRRLFVGGLVAVALPARGAVTYARFETYAIQSLTGTAVTLTATPATPFPAGTRVFPLVLCEVDLSTSTKTNRGGLPSLAVEASEVTGPTALPALANPGDVTSVWPTAYGYPVFFPGPSSPGRTYGWGGTADGWRRDGRISHVGFGQVAELLGPRPRATASRTARAVTRANAWPLLQLFDLVRGRTFPFFIPAAQYLTPPTAITTTTVAIPAAGPLADWAAYPYVAVVGREASPTAARIRAVSAVNRSAGVDTLTLATALDSTAVTSAIGAAPARLVRFDSADLTERWKTTTDLSLAFDVVEVQAEQAVAISNL